MTRKRSTEKIPHVHAEDTVGARRVFPDGGGAGGVRLGPRPPDVRRLDGLACGMGAAKAGLALCPPRRPRTPSGRVRAVRAPCVTQGPAGPLPPCSLGRSQPPAPGTKSWSPCRPPAVSLTHNCSASSALDASKRRMVLPPHHLQDPSLVSPPQGTPSPLRSYLSSPPGRRAGCSPALARRLAWPSAEALQVLLS